MSNYTKSTNFASKDSLASGNPLKIVKGTEIDTEFNNIATAVATKADTSSPTLVTPNLGTPSAAVLTNATGLPLTSGVTGILPVANGGTGSSTASAARTALGLVIGTNVQAWDADLDAFAAKTAPTGTIVGTTDTQTLTNKTITSPTINGTVTLSTGLVSSSTAVTASGTTVDFTGIPSWAKRVTILFNGVSTTGTAGYIVQVGAGSVETTGYTAGVSSGNGAVTTATSTAGFYINRAGSVTAAAAYSGHLTLTLLGSNTWIGSGVGFDTSPGFNVFAGNKTTSGALDRVRVTTIGGTDTFDAGSINIFYE